MVIMGKKEKLLIVLVVLVGTASLVRTIVLIWYSTLLDFGVYYYSAQSILAHTNPYLNPQLFTQASYPPVTFLFITPLAILPIDVASKIWIALSVGSFLASLLFLYKTVSVPVIKIACIFLAVVLSFPFKFTMGMGQINLMVLLVLSASIFFLKKRMQLSAFLLSIAIILKLFPAFLLIWFLFKRQFRYIVFTILFTFIFFLISLIYSGSDIYMYYLREIVASSLLEPAGSVYYNQSITGFFARLELPGIVLAIARIAIFLVTVIIIARKKLDAFGGLALLLTTVLLINSFSWQHHFILLLIPFYMLLSHSMTKKQWFFIIISYILVSMNIKDPKHVENVLFSPILLSHGFSGTLLLWYMQISKKDWTEKKK